MLTVLATSGLRWSRNPPRLCAEAKALSAILLEINRNQRNTDWLCQWRPTCERTDTAIYGDFATIFWLKINQVIVILQNCRPCLTSHRGTLQPNHSAIRETEC